MIVEIHFCFFPLLFFASKANETSRSGGAGGKRTTLNKHRQHSINGASSSADCATCGKRRSTAGPHPPRPRLLQRYFCALIALNRQIQLSRGSRQFRNSRLPPTNLFPRSRPRIAESLISVFEWRNLNNKRTNYYTKTVIKGEREKAGGQRYQEQLKNIHIQWDK